MTDDRDISVLVGEDASIALFKPFMSNIGFEIVSSSPSISLAAIVLGDTIR